MLAPGRTPLSYTQLLNQVETTVERLQQWGTQRQDRIVIVLPNGPLMAVALLAVSCAAVSVPLNPDYTASEFEFHLADLAATAVILLTDLDSPIRAVAQARGLPLLEIAPTGEQAGLFDLLLPPAPHKDAPTPREQVAQSHDVALLLYTSGTTAHPKLIPLSQGNLCTSAQQIAASLGLTPADRCLNVMSFVHIHSLASALLATIAAGGSIVCMAGFDAAAFLAWLEIFQPTWYTAVPAIHQAILIHARQQPTPLDRGALRFIRSSSTTLPPTMMAELEQCFQVPVIEGYGMTEAAGQLCSNPLPPAPRKAGSVGRPAGPTVAIMAEDSTTLLAPGEYGEIVIRGASTMNGYANNPTANQQAFTQGWFRTGDQGYFDADGYLFISNRLKELINRGGAKIAPSEVDHVLLTHPAVAQAVTFAIPHPTLGEDMGAAVVLKTPHAATERELREFAFSQLAGYKVPTQIVIVAEIPLGASGKVQRIGLADKFADKFVREFVAPTGLLETTLAQIWAEVLDKTPIGIFDNFFTLGGDSLLGMQVIARLTTRLGIEILPSQLFAAPSVAELADLIVQEQVQKIDATDLLDLLTEIEMLSPAKVKHQLDQSTALLAPRHFAAAPE